MVWSEDRIPDRGRQGVAEASVGAGVHGAGSGGAVVDERAQWVKPEATLIGRCGASFL